MNGTDETLPTGDTFNETPMDRENGPQKVKRTVKRVETLPENKTKIISKKKTEEILSSTETSVESKNITNKDDGKDVETVTVIEKQVEQEACHNKTTDTEIESLENELEE